MKLTELKCTSCNGTLRTDENNPDIAVCEYCGSRFLIEQEAGEGVRLGAPAPMRYVPRNIGADHRAGQAGSAGQMRTAEPDRSAGRMSTEGQAGSGRQGKAAGGAGSMSGAGRRGSGLVRNLLVGVLGLVLVAGVGSKVISSRSADAPLYEEAMYYEDVTEVEEIPPFIGIFAAMAEEVTGRPAKTVSPEELGSFRWLELSYTPDTIEVGYSMADPYEDPSAALSWVSLPREGSREEFAQLSRFTGLVKLNIPNYLPPEALEGLALRGLGCYVKSPEEIYSSYDRADGLRELILDYSTESLAGIQEFTNLESLTVGSSHLTDLKELAGMKSLRSLTLGNCDEVTDFSVFSVMPWLEELSIESEGIRDIGFVAGMKNLTSLSLTDAAILNLDGASALTSLSLVRCGELKDCGAVAGLSGLEQLNLELPYGCAEPELGGLTGLKSLRISGFERTSFLKELKNLESLTLDGCQISGPSMLDGLELLRELKCSHVYGDLTDWSFVSRVSSLESLDLKGVSTYEDISGLFDMPSLVKFCMSGMECELDFSKLAPNPVLEVLEMDGIKLYTNVKVSGEGGITYVDYDPVSLDEHTDFLVNFQGIRELSLAENKLTSLSFAASLPSLETLNIDDNYVTDLKPLQLLPALRLVRCQGNPVENLRVLDERVKIKA